MSRLAWCAVVAAAAAGVGRAGSPDPAALAVPPEQVVKARALVRQLGSDVFRDRDRATRELEKMGRLALPALAAGGDDRDPEVRLRAGLLLPRAEADDLRARVETFLADAGGRFRHDLPGWDAFRAAAGDDPATRSLFARVVRNLANRDLLRALHEATAARPLGLPAVAGGAARDPAADRDLGRALTARRQQMYFTQILTGGPSGNRITAADVPDNALLLLAESLTTEQQAPAMGFQYRVTNFFFSPAGRDAVTGAGTDGPAVRRLALRWLDTREGMPAVQTAMGAAQAAGFEPEVVAKAAARVIVAADVPPLAKASAAGVVVRSNSRAHLPALTRLFADDSVIQRGGPGNPVLDVQVRDFAFGMALALTGQTPAGYGLEVRNSTDGMRYVYTNYVFRPGADGTADEKRAVALARWKAWEAGVYGSAAGVAAAAASAGERFAAK